LEPDRWRCAGTSFHVYSGFEKKVAQSIREGRSEGPRRHFRRDPGATEEVVEVKRGAKVSSERKYFPGYVLIKMDLTTNLAIS